MAVTHFRRAGGSTIVTVPAKIMEAAGLTASSAVDFEWDEAAKVIVMRPARPRYTMADLLAQCDPNASLTDEDTLWLNDGPIGQEAI